ncbi:LamG-like jellyroll fold domain-containing protein [Cellulomonas citrea]|uniref:LamG-like jellyroll fold domain-containing protein n=1 Tax=Cellulomonas citrea TaxID=1909423 RepID=UPI0013593F37|nr:LamG-like jellyroll fold domain-containing protein [Cellulomonas citrea]
MRASLRRLVAVSAATVVGLGAAVIAAPAASATGCATYYVSSAAGNDANDGCSPSTPWQTLTNVNATTFAPGNQILLAAGGSWTGTLAPQGSGASGNPVVVSSYGSGAAPIVAGGGAAAAVSLLDQHDWTIQNLEITNTATTLGYRAGIHVGNDTTGSLHGIHIVNNTIHDIAGNWNTNDPQPVNTSAIAFELSDANTTSGWDDILIDGNTLTKTDAGAIYIGSLKGLNHDKVTTGVVIQNNTITNAGGNSIVCVFCSAPLIQYNVSTDSGYRFSGAALWSGWTTNGIWQYNEVARNWKSFVDGQAFDIDNNDSGTVLQYNYTHDNPWGFMEFCCSATFGVSGTSTIRYNISQNDGASNANIGLLGGLTPGAVAQVYNNTFYMPAGNNGDLTAGTPSSGASAVFTNNVIYKLGTGGYATTRTTWNHNLMYGNHPSSEPADAAKVTADPLLVAPGGAGSGRASAAAYKLRTGSPALGAGALVAGNGGLDYFGNPVSSSAAPNIGAYNGAGVAAPAPTPGGFWRFDTGSGTAALDASGNNNPGVLQAGASWAAGRMGPFAVALNGSSTGFVDIPTTAVDTSGSYTVQAWVKPTTTTGNQTYASIDGSVISPFYLQLSGGSFAFTQRSADSTSSSYTQAVGPAAVAGTWYNLMGVYDSVAHTIKLYVNGVLQSTASYSSAWKATGHTTIGRAKWNRAPVDFANATIDDVRMIPRALTDREAFAIGSGASAYFAFNEDAGRTFADVTGYTVPGWLTGSAGWAAGEAGAGALALDGTKGTWGAVGATPIDTSASFAVDAWVKLSSLSGNQTFVSSYGANVSPFYLQLAGGKFTFTTRPSDATGATASSVASTLTPTAGVWYHVLGTFDASAGSISLYVNGSLQGSASAASIFRVRGATALGSAVWARTPVDFVNGAIDEVHFYNRTLTSAEIATLATP